ncbi:hypothetical protein MNBD_GAMMA23-2206 [hydrothermal vent metagenome]|uniref:Thioredoxin domain-containing protein n=1 Tax=hydrothermal vent metagenome TaxID=652676 RepID=A0A3B1AK18_9ZZZZ
MIKFSLTKLGLIILLSIAMHSTGLAVVKYDELEVQIDSQSLSIKKIEPKSTASDNKDLIIWVAPGYGTSQRAMDMSADLSKLGLEIWYVDLAESLFLPKSTSTMRNLDGKYLAGLIEYAHKKTNKRITLLTRSYGAIPVLRAARQWQLKHAGTENFYLNGAILYSPELYSKVPSLGLEPEFVSITEATNIPLMIFQSGKRGNRWQIKKLLSKLQSSGAAVYFKILKGVTGVFYSGDKKAATLKQIELMPKKIQAVIKLFSKTEKPEQVAMLKHKVDVQAKSLDIKLKSYKANPTPHVLDLVDVFGKRHTTNNYKGKVTVINFWATWCPPCVQEIPSLNNLRQLMANEKFELISVNYGEDKEAILSFMKKVNVDFPVLLDPSGKEAKKWNVLVFPSTFVIAPNGLIKYGVNAAIHWDDPSVVKALKALLK